MELVLFFLIFSILFLYGVIEKSRHKKALSKIPIRIHVNGTRGKSSVARLIAAGLRAGDLKTIAKTSGSEASLIFEDGSEQKLLRGIQPNIIEQSKIVGIAAKRQAEALVIECMALRPDFQSFCERELVQSTHGVITNVGPDHFDVMGPTVRDVAKALAGTVPVRSRLYTNEKTYRDVFIEAVEDRKSELVPLPDAESVTLQELEGFRYIEHAENVALALQVCEDVGVDRSVALRGMQESPYDVGALTIHPKKMHKSEIIFVNAFGANDPISTKRCWNLICSHYPKAKQKILLVCCRDDRQERSIQLAEMAANLDNADQFIVVGKSVDSFLKTALKLGIPYSRLRDCSKVSPKDMATSMTHNERKEQILIVGAGNIKQAGFELLNYFQEASGTTSLPTQKKQQKLEKAG